MSENTEQQQNSDEDSSRDEDIVTHVIYILWTDFRPYHSTVLMKRNTNPNTIFRF